MNTEINESLLEVAIRLMKSKKKPKDMDYITKEVFQIKGIRDDNTKEKLKAQFQFDFMTSGDFICCGESKRGHKLWDLKNRQPSSLLDKDGSYLEDLYVDEDAIINELKDDDYEIKDKDEEEDEDETDDIEEELNLTVGEDDEDDITAAIIDDDIDDLEDLDTELEEEKEED